MNIFMESSKQYFIQICGIQRKKRKYTMEESALISHLIMDPAMGFLMSCAIIIEFTVHSCSSSARIISPMFQIRNSTNWQGDLATNEGNLARLCAGMLMISGGCWSDAGMHSGTIAVGY